MPRPGKKRLDVLLVERGLAESRNQAQSLILAGQVRVFDALSRLRAPSQVKPGALVAESDCLQVLSLPRFVSRGGEKLQAALDTWKIPVNNRTCLDIGASTGGFTDCLLQNGARLVYALDVGHGQFHPRLRSDPRVRLIEKTHILRWEPQWEAPPNLAVMDLSFISLTKVLEKAAGLLGPGSQILALVKPQFELDAKRVRKGVVRDATLRAQAVSGVAGFAGKIGLDVAAQFPCPLKGAKGNQEEWLLLNKAR